jgi:hypothetical protein
MELNTYIFSCQTPTHEHRDVELLAVSLAVLVLLFLPPPSNKDFRFPFDAIQRGFLSDFVLPPLSHMTISLNSVAKGDTAELEKE